MSQQERKKRKPTFTKKDLATYIANSDNIELDAAVAEVEHVVAAIRNIMMTANPELRIEIRDFGVFEVKSTKSKPKARNPHTGEIIHVPAHKKTHFKPGKVLKNFLDIPADDAGSAGNV